MCNLFMTQKNESAERIFQYDDTMLCTYLSSFDKKILFFLHKKIEINNFIFTKFKRSHKLIWHFKKYKWLVLNNRQAWNYLLIFGWIPYSIECPYFPFRLYIGDETVSFFFLLDCVNMEREKQCHLSSFDSFGRQATTHAWKTSLKREEENILWQLGQSLLKRWE